MNISSQDLMANTCGRYCAEVSSAGYEQGISSGLSQINIFIYALFFASSLILIINILLNRKYTKDLCSENSLNLKRRKQLLEIRDIMFFMILGISTIMLVYSLGFIGVSVV